MADADVIQMDLRSGSRGDAVRDLQTRLKGWGFDPGAVDGIYGPKTEAAVRALQNKLKVPATGAYDATTRAAVVADLQSRSSVLNSTGLVLHSDSQTKAEAEVPFYKSPLFMIGAGLLLLFLAFKKDGSGAFADDDADEAEPEAPALEIDSADDLTAFIPAIERMRKPRAGRRRKALRK